MTRINLLPPEIVERRKAEKRMSWVALGAVLVGVILLGAYAYGYWSVNSRQDELALVQQQVRATQAQADQLAIFEQRATELTARKETATLALAGCRNWAKIFTEMSLVLPSDVWIETMAADEESGLQIAGYAVDSATDTPDLGHKTMAKTLVRLADLEQLQDVWLTTSVKDEYEERPAIRFTVTAGLAAAASDGEAK